VNQAKTEQPPASLTNSQLRIWSSDAYKKPVVSEVILVFSSFYTHTASTRHAFYKPPVHLKQPQVNPHAFPLPQSHLLSMSRPSINPDTSTPVDIPTDSASIANKAHGGPISPPLDPSKLNQQLAPLPPARAPVQAADSSSAEQPQQPLRSPESSAPGGVGESAYLDTGVTETPSHPTVAETGDLGESAEGPGPKSGQLKRREGGEKKGDGIIKLGSLGGEGLTRKPPMASPTREERS
jgi:hypothetical protein